jgi:hypothetical protein
MTKLRTRRWAAVLALAAALGAAGCGDRSNEEVGNSGDREGQSPGVTEGTNPAAQEDRVQTPEGEDDTGQQEDDTGLGGEE